MRSLPKFFLYLLVVLSLFSLMVYSPSLAYAQEEDFSEEEEEIEEEEEEEAEPTPTSAPSPTSTPVPSPTTSEEEDNNGEVLGGATELGDTGAEHLIYIIAGLVGLVVVIAGVKVARSDVEE